MDEILCDVEKTVSYEVACIKQKYGERYHSWHEAYGVLEEEITEAVLEFESVKTGDIPLLRGIQRNDNATVLLALDLIANHAVRAASELIQVAAVCRKALGGVEVQDK